MLAPFYQLFLITGEAVRDVLLPFLNWRDLGRLDNALMNRVLREQYCGWLLNAKRVVCLASSANLSLLNWMVRKKMKVSTLGVYSEAGVSLLPEFPSSTLEVAEVQFHMSGSVQFATTMAFLVSLKGIDTISMYSGSFDFSDSSAWNAPLNPHLFLRNLKIVQFGRNNHRLTAEFIAQIARSYPLLEIIVLRHCVDADDTSVALLAQHCKQLKQLHLAGCKLFTNLSLQSLGMNCGQLQGLYLEAKSGSFSDTGVQCVLQRCRKLAELHLWDCSGVTDRSIVALAAQNAHLPQRKFALCKSSAFGSYRAAAAMLQFRDLTELNFSGCSNLCEQQLSAVICNNPQLHSLDLSDVETVTDNVVAVISNSCPSLWFLYLNRCLSVTDVAGLGQCRRLIVLELTGCLGVTEATLFRLVDTPGHELHVEVGGTSVDTAAFAALQRSGRLQLQLSN